ncbi:GH92 family glycosyl hydrolase [Niabella drilacis]|uniref:Alpha-1,2-mannosidase, putative n=1 Tax=Niabella drilacis (strain DSM 25811 / CCM 8410 / CCUG 62505 / LMG 26954 / E90) TaxID=1285928 RepID=A0A1G6RMT3_NIADE|nr:GH92 family glycosyl hydrolase [Niabella drilacis]SDD05267.1 alpha-1,2-mannosidase, putative [Niabella drilacis]
MFFLKNLKGLLLVCLTGSAVFLSAQRNIDHVNMLIGSTGESSTEYGGTTPAVTQPYGMTQWCAVTRINGISRTMYHYNDKKLLGFMATHQPAVWMGDYGFFTLMPQVGKLKIQTQERAVILDRSKETATPYYYKVSYEDGGLPVTTEFTATSRCSFFRVKYPQKGKAILFLEAGREKEGGGIEIIPERQEIRIYNKERHDSHLGPRLHHFKGCYVLKFSRPFAAFGTWNDGRITEKNKKEEGAHVGGFIEFSPGTDIVEIKTGSSFISYDQAVINMEKELPRSATFSEIKERVKKEWAKNLDKIAIKGASDEDLDIFYTAFFRTMQYPREFSEHGRYYSPFDEKVHDGVSYSAYSLWDTFRALHPWLLLTQPARVNDMVTALVQMYKEGGWIPKWPNPTYTNIMIGTHADAVIADAYVNGFRNYDLETAYQAIRKDAFVAPRGDYRWGDRAPWNGSYEARAGLDHYMKAGYVAADKTNESASRTLEFAMDDYCVAQMAKGLGHREDYDILMRRTKNYERLFNKETGFFQARNSNGSWAAPDEGFTEGGKWTYRFCVMQDIPGLIRLLGGERQFVAELDRNFEDGHYHHDNEPGHHFAYMYSYCNRLDKTQSRIPGIIKKNYQDKPDGLSGNDDCGQMSAWYLFSSLGFYPLAPASGEYALGIPHFKEITVKLENGKQLRIKAPELGEKALLTKVRFNGKVLDKPFIPVREILKGGTLVFRSEK